MQECTGVLHAPSAPHPELTFHPGKSFTPTEPASSCRFGLTPAQKIKWDRTPKSSFLPILSRKKNRSAQTLRFDKAKTEEPYSALTEEESEIS